MSQVRFSSSGGDFDWSLFDARSGMFVYSEKTQFDPAAGTHSLDECCLATAAKRLPVNVELLQNPVLLKKKQKKKNNNVSLPAVDAPVLCRLTKTEQQKNRSGRTAVQTAARRLHTCSG